MNARAITKYTWISYTAARSNLAYLSEVLSRTTFMAVLLYTFMRLWAVVYSGSGSQRLGGLTLPQMIWYLTITESLALSSPRVSMEIDEDVRTGRLSVQLLRPLSYVLARLAQVLGERSVRFAVNLTAGSVVALLLVGPIHLSMSGVGMFALTLPLAFVIDFLSYFAIGLCAFWLESTAGITLIYSRLTMLLGGMLLPLEIFPARLREIALHLPFASVIYGPARTFVSADVGVLRQTIVTQFTALFLLTAVVYAVQRRAMKQIQSHGG